MAKRESPLTIETLTADPRNANRGTARGRELVESSIRDFGMGRPVLADRKGRLIAGHKTVEGAKAAGVKKTIIVKTKGDALIVHQREDLDLSRDKKARELAVVDNRANEVGLEWAKGTLQALSSEGHDMKKAGFTEAELASLFGTADAADELIPEMQVRPFEHHDYIVVVFTNSQDWSQACELLGIRREAMTVGKLRKIGLGRVVPASRLLTAVQGKRKGAKK